MNPIRALFLILALFAGGQANAQEMTFEMSADRSVIIAEGMITDLTPGRLYEFVTANDLAAKPMMVAFNSLGGKLREGLDLSAMIRNFKFNTEVHGVCASACVYAFLGGVERSFGPRGELYVHRFTSVRMAEIVQRNLIRHAVAMGATADIMEVAYEVEPTDFRLITLDEARKWNVVTPKLLGEPNSAIRAMLPKRP